VASAKVREAPQFTRAPVLARAGGRRWFGAMNSGGENPRFGVTVTGGGRVRAK
jgi:hypothetical protein